MRPDRRDWIFGELVAERSINMNQSGKRDLGIATIGMQSLTPGEGAAV
jgi:hypothetical protein